VRGGIGSDENPRVLHSAGSQGVKPERLQPPMPWHCAQGCPCTASGRKLRIVETRDEIARKPVVRRDEGCAGPKRRGEIECDHEGYCSSLPGRDDCLGGVIA
jgi:hypothetical protein